MLVGQLKYQTQSFVRKYCIVCVAEWPEWLMNHNCYVKQSDLSSETSTCTFNTARLVSCKCHICKMLLYVPPKCPTESNWHDARFHISWTRYCWQPWFIARVSHWALLIWLMLDEFPADPLIKRSKQDCQHQVVNQCDKWFDRLYKSTQLPTIRKSWTDFRISKLIREWYCRLSGIQRIQLFPVPRQKRDVRRLSGRHPLPRNPFSRCEPLIIHRHLLLFPSFSNIEFRMAEIICLRSSRPRDLTKSRRIEKANRFINSQTSTTRRFWISQILFNYDLPSFIDRAVLRQLHRLHWVLGQRQMDIWPDTNRNQTEADRILYHLLILL